MPALEAFAVATGLASVVLTARMHPANWPVGLASVLAFAAVFWGARLYANAALQGIFAVLALIGWRRWRGDAAVAGRLDAHRAPLRALVALALVAIAAAAGSALLLARASDSPAPIADAAMLAASLAATWAQTRRWIACWPIWIGVDAIGVPLYLAQGLYPTAALYVVLAAICVDGWRRWQRMQA